MVKYLQQIKYVRGTDGKQTTITEDRMVTVERRNQLRETVCQGCRHNFYNYPREYSPQSVEVREDEGCWFLERVNLRHKKNPCPLHNKY